MHGLKASAARVEDADADKLVRRMLAEYGTAQLYEWYQASTIGRVVFDVDAKTSKTTAPALLDAAIAGVAAFFNGELPTHLTIAASHGLGKGHTNGDKLSYRIFVHGVRARMSDIKARLVRLGLDKNRPFDAAIYGANQKLRMVGSIKTPDDRRPLKLVDRQGVEIAPTADLLLATLLQVVEDEWPLLEEDSHSIKPPKKARVTALLQPPSEPAQPSPSPQMMPEPALSSSYRVPEDRDAVLRLLVENGFVDPQFVGLPRSTSLTFKAENRSRCPCCNQDHEKHNWWATEDRDGVLLAKSYSDRCRLMPMRSVPQLLPDRDAAQDLIKERLALVERRQDQTELEVGVIKHTLLDFGPHIESALNQDIAVDSVVMRPDAHGFAFNCSNDRNDYCCDIIATPTCRLSCTSDKTMPAIVAGWAGNVTLNDIINNPDRADTAYVDWFQCHEKNQLGIDWRFDNDFFYSDGGTWTRVTTGKDSNLEFLEQRFLQLLRPRLALLDQIANSGSMPLDMDNAEKKRIKTGARKAYNHIQHWRTTKALVQAARVSFYTHGFAEGMDRDRHLLGTPDGVVDLRTGCILPPGHGFQVSMRTRAKFGGLDVPTPDVDRVFTTIFNGDQDMVRWFQLFLGMAITGEKTETYACFTGSGANGKSLTLDWIHQVVGSQYYCEADRSIFFGARHTGGATPYLADLLSRRLAVFQECDPTQDSLNIADLKRNTGNSPFTARRLYCPPFEVDPTHTQILATNSLPQFDGTDYAVVRRCVVVPFHMQFKHGAEYDHTQPLHRPADAGLESFLHAPERCCQLLTWMVTGAVEWYAAGTPKLSAQTPDVMKEAKRAYVEDNDPVGAFISENCTPDPSGWVSEQDFNSRAPQVSGGMKPLLERKGLLRVRQCVDGKRSWGWKGLTWRK